MELKREKRHYPYFSVRDGRYKVQTVTYDLWFEGEVLMEIRNECHHKVEVSSEVWGYFLQKYHHEN